MVASAAARRSAPSTGGVQSRGPPRGHCHSKPLPESQPQSSDRSFPLFPKLPVELRRQIWQLATGIRPRVIQIYYEPNAKKWEACSDGRGGLSALLGTSQEARSEAIRGYTNVFDTLIDLQKDTVFISDPMFCLKKQRTLLLKMECMKLVKNAAFTSEMFHGLLESSNNHPKLNASPGQILRELEGLEHFSFVVSEDGIGLEEVLEMGEDEELVGFGDSETEGDDTNGEIASIEEESGQGPEIHPPHPAQDDENERDWEEEQAFEQMSKRGYFRHTGNIHFESAYRCIDYGDEFEMQRSYITLELRREKARHGDWILPKISIVEVKYGLNQIGDFHQCLHSYGDHSVDILEQAFDARRYSMEEDFNEPSECTSDESDGEY